MKTLTLKKKSIDYSTHIASYALPQKIVTFFYYEPGICTTIKQLLRRTLVQLNNYWASNFLNRRFLKIKNVVPPRNGVQLCLLLCNDLIEMNFIFFHNYSIKNKS